MPHEVTDLIRTMVRDGRDDQAISDALFSQWPDLDTEEAARELVSARLAAMESASQALPAGWGKVPIREALDAVRHAEAETRPFVPAAFVPIFPPEPEPIPRPVQAPPPDLPLDLLPGPIRDVAEDLNRRLSVPVGFFAGPALLAAGALIQIRVKAGDGFHVPPVLWCVLSAPSGSMKSAPAGLAIRPLQLLEETWSTEHETARAAFERDSVLWKAESKRLQKIVDEGGPEAVQAAERLTSGEPEPPTRRRVLIADSTPEKTAMLLIENPGGLLAWTDELSLRLDSGAKKGREDQHALDLASFEASGPHLVDRVGRGSIVVQSPRLAIGGTTQPGVLRDFVDKSRPDGWFERPIYLEFRGLPDYAPSRLPRDAAAESRYFKAIMRLADLDPAEVGAQLHENGGFWFLPFDAEGKDLYRDWLDFVEQAIRLPIWEDHPRLASWLGKTRSLAPKLALVCHLLEGGRGAIPARALARSIGLTLVLFQHAGAVLAPPAKEDLPPVVLLADLLREEEIASFTVRDIRRRERQSLDQGAIDEACVELVRLGWLAEERKKGPGRPTIKYHVNPALFGEGVFRQFWQSNFLKELEGLISSVIEKTLDIYRLDNIYINQKIPLYTTKTLPTKRSTKGVLEKRTAETDETQYKQEKAGKTTEKTPSVSSAVPKPQTAETDETQYKQDQSLDTQGPPPWVEDLTPESDLDGYPPSAKNDEE